MIDIKVYKKKKKNGSSSSASSGSNSTPTSITPANDWFFFDSDNNAVGCRYDFYSVGGVTANGAAMAEAAGFTVAQIAALTALANNATVLQALANATTVSNGDVSITATIAQPQQQQNP